MKLYYSQAACSMASHIIINELNLPYQAELVNLKEKTCAQGDFLAINPKGCVPALIMESGELLTENAVILQYLADLKPELKLFAPQASLQRYRIQEWLNFIATDLHKNYTPLFMTKRFVQSEVGQNELKASMKTLIDKKCTWVNTQLSGKSFLTGPEFTIADAYLFTVLSWNKFVGIELQGKSNLSAYMERITARPSVQKVLKIEGLLK
jgi:glutathione S-transferase